MRASRTILVIVAAVTVSLAPNLAGNASGDSIYLKNGRVIRSDDVKVDGARLVFYQHGAYQAIPMSLVDRIEADDWSEAGGEARRPLPKPDLAAGPGTRADTGGPPASSAAALQSLSGMLNDGVGGVDTSQALQLLQSLGAQQGASGAGGLEALLPLLGMLGSEGGAQGLGGLGGVASDLGTIQTVLPALSRLGAALFAPEYSAAATEAAARDLIIGLESLGVSRADIRARAQQLGVPPEILDRIRND